MSPRHARPSRLARLLRWRVLAAVVVVLALGAGGFVAYQQFWSDSETPTTPIAATTSAAPTFDVPAPSTETDAAAALPSDKPAAANGPGPCTEVRVLASLENADVLQAAATAYAAAPRNVSGRCVTISVTSDKSGLAASAAGQGFPALTVAQKPTLWVPDSDTWLGIAAAANKGLLVPADATTVAQSGVVVAMPKKMAQATSWQVASPTWTQVFATAGDADFWKSTGHPEWGPFKFAKTSPQVASSGLFALMASYGAAVGKQTGFTAGQVKAASTVKKVSAAELTISHYMTTPEQFLARARQADAQGSIAGFLSAIIVDEKSVWDYNRGLSSVDGTTTTLQSPPKEKLVPIYPAEGVYVAKSSASVLSGAWVSAPQKAASADFVRYLTTQQGQQIVRTNGYRDILGSADPEIAGVGTLDRKLTAMAPPSTDVAVAVQQSFGLVRKKARVLFLVDLSGSMQETAPGGGTKLAGAQAAILSALDYFGPDDQVGLAGFSNLDGEQIAPGVVTQIAPLATNGPALQASLAAFKPISQTPLYNAVSRFTTDVAAGYDPDLINAVIVLSDGENDSSLETTLEQTLSTLSPITSKTPTLVFTLAYGDDAVAAPLQAIAKATGGQYYDATNATTLADVLADLVTSF